MDKASKWFRSILGLKSRDKPPPSSKRRWSSVKSYREKDSSSAVANVNANGGVRDDPADHNDKHAIAAVAETAVSADQAASAVFRLTGSSGGCARDPAVHGALEESAAVKIQSTFRGYLARRALRALKGLVKLQALVRGHIERKRTKEWLRKMQALLQAQTRARAVRSRISEHSRFTSKSSHFHHPFNQRNGSKLSGRTLDTYEHIDEQACVQRVHSTRIDPTDDEKNERRNMFHSTHLASSSDLYSCSFTNSVDTHRSVPTSSSCEVQSFYPLKYSNDVEERFSANTNSPNFYSASTKGGSSKRSPYGSTSYLSSYSDHPNYMSYTESSRAKARSMSAPKLRPQHDGSNSAKRYSIPRSGELKSRTLKSALHANFACKAYPGSGRLDRLGLPVEYRC